MLVRNRNVCVCRGGGLSMFFFFFFFSRYFFFFPEKGREDGE